ncbi:MAG TPA: hypothetical protein VK661_11345, partial [Planctomycetota bacterium]|nr:hypothetical protein [Planctomycetota bacterium]
MSGPMVATAKARFQQIQARKVGAPPPPADFITYLDQISAAIIRGHDQWRGLAIFTPFMINGPMAIGGKLQGPDMGPFILAGAPLNAAQGNSARYNGAIARAIGKAWKMFELSVQGNLLFPSFASVPGGFAPPQPCVPTPLAAFASLPILAGPLTDMMKTELGSPGPFSDAIFESIAGGFEMAANQWKAMQQIFNIMGQGPAPVMGGPVMGGTTIPGCPFRT